MSDQAEHLKLVEDAPKDSPDAAAPPPAPPPPGAAGAASADPSASGELPASARPVPPPPRTELPAPPPKPADPLVGQTIDGRYLIEGKLGEGGMGVVYQCKHVVLEKKLAMKILRADVSRDQEIISRFRQEAQSASAIGSQHIIDISDFGQLADGATYFVMEHLGGKELTKVIEDEQPIPPERVIHVAKQLCDALGAAHDRGIVHRDMKPDNVFLIPRMGDDDFVKVLDFGIAKVGGASSKLTKAGQVFGTPHYMSPEQCAGQGVDNRTDIYALGVILYEMSCGKVPFDADNLMGILTKHIYEQPIPLRELPPPVEVPPGLEAVILKCLAKSTDVRYQTMAEVKADLEAIAAGHTPGAVMDAMNRVGGRHDPTGNHAMLQVGVGGAEEGSSKLPLVLGAVVGLVALLMTGVALYFVFGQGEDPPADPIVVAPPEPEPEVVVDAGIAAEETTVVADTETPVEAPELMLTVTSEPVGVEVWVVDGEETLAGNTPFEVAQPSRGEFVSLILKQPGYRDHPIRVGHYTSTEVHVTLRQGSTGSQPGQGSGRRRRRRGGEQQQQQQQQEQTPAGRRRGIGSEVLDPWG